MKKPDLNLFLMELQQLRDPKRAVWDQSYHKSQREHWGISAPARDGLIRKLCKELTESDLLFIARELWETNLFDLMLCGAKILSFSKVKPSQALWELILLFLGQVDGWALEDQLAHGAWKCILSNQQLLDELDQWTKHANFWMRRAALVYTLPFAKVSQNPERMLGWASHYASDPEWFIQKAIGWWLRVLGAHNPERVTLFLRAHWNQLKGVARKEATRKLSKEWLTNFESSAV